MQSYTIFNDPIHGSTSVPHGLLSELVDHAIFQRLRRIRQIGLGHLVFPGGEHTRFGHALGAMHLMRRILERLKIKGVSISEDELEGASIAALLHDIGHGPLSHALEHILIQDFHHEMMTDALMQRLNEEFNGKLELGISIFKGTYHRPFFHQLVSSQLDVDRLDYMLRDSFHTGVKEGQVGLERLIETLTVEQDRIFVLKKGIYALENYIMARNLMYKQVYLHKTNLSADTVMHHIFERLAVCIHEYDFSHILSPALYYFLSEKPSAKHGLHTNVIEHYINLDDMDLWFAVKQLQKAEDPILAFLCKSMIDRRLFKVRSLENGAEVDEPLLQQKIANYLDQKHVVNISKEDLRYFYAVQDHSLEAYNTEKGAIFILFEDGSSREFSTATDTEHIRSLMQKVRKHYVMHLKGIDAGFIRQQGVIFS